MRHISKGVFSVLLVLYTTLAASQGIATGSISGAAPGLSGATGAPQSAARTQARRSLETVFRYQPEKIEPGTVYHYVKSNIDGSRPAQVTVYVASRTHLEVLKIYPGVPYGFNVTADMDWTHFEADHLMQWAIHKDGSRALQDSGLMIDAGRTFRTLAKEDPTLIKPSTLDLPIRYHPLHIYSFDFTSLNFVFRHLWNPQAAFGIGVIGVAADSSLAYRGKAEVRFVRNEMRHGVVCRVYRVDGPGMENTRGTIWVNQRLGHIEDMEFPLADNPDWTSFKFELKSIEKMNDFTWNQWMLSQAKAIP